jgi:hypothetical protein
MIDTVAHKMYRLGWESLAGLIWSTYYNVLGMPT